MTFATPDYDKDFLLDTDASAVALRAVLSQVHICNGKEEERPIYFYSRSFSPAERNYSTTEREGLAVVAAVRRIRP